MNWNFTNLDFAKAIFPKKQEFKNQVFSFGNPYSEDVLSVSIKAENLL